MSASPDSVNCTPPAGAPADTAQSPGDAAPAAGPDAADDAYLRRFRHWLRDGRVHPLLHLMQQYRAEADE